MLTGDKKRARNESGHAKCHVRLAEIPGGNGDAPHVYIHGYGELVSAQTNRVGHEPYQCRSCRD
eukprot:9617739-Alexandrium_andersonii.AAC.1